MIGIGRQGPDMTATVIKMSVQRMVCTGCGAEANASCNCGVAYQPKSIRAAEAIRANPEKSDRALAADLGIGHATVSRARETVSSETVDSPRIGLDRKTRRLPVREVDADEPDDRDFAKKQFIFAAESILETGKDALGYVERMKFAGNEAGTLCEITGRIISQWNDVMAALRKSST